MPCDVCQGDKRVRLPTYADLEMIPSGDGLPTGADQGWKEFDCPQCCMVPFRRVRATKVTTAYPAETVGKMQVPIERALAARFGEYLYREGLIKFTTDGTSDFGRMRDQVTVTAHLGVVSREDVRRAEAPEEVAVAPTQPLKQDKQGKRLWGSRGKAWEPPLPAGWSPDPVTDEFDEPMDALGARFSGLEI